MRVVSFLLPAFTDCLEVVKQPGKYCFIYILEVPKHPAEHQCHTMVYIVQTHLKI